MMKTICVACGQEEVIPLGYRLCDDCSGRKPQRKEQTMTMLGHVVEWAENGLADWQEGDADTYVSECGHPSWESLIGYILRAEAENASLTEKVGRLEDAAQEAIEEIEYWHKDMLSHEERTHPRGNGWARVYDKLRRALLESE